MHTCDATVSLTFIACFCCLGVLGGIVHEAMTDVVHLMASLVDSQGKILVEGIMDDVKPVTPEEEALYDDIEFDVEDFKDECRVKTVSNKLPREDKKSLLMARWRYPSLSLHGIEGAFSGAGPKTVIPAKVLGKFSLRLVPDQSPKRITELVTKHLEKEFSKVSFVLLDSRRFGPSCISLISFIIPL